MAFSSPEVVSGKIIDKQYVGQRTSVGNGINSNGTSVLTVESSPEQFLFIVNIDDKIVSATCEPERYYVAQIGSNVNVVQYHGLFTKIVFASKIQK